MLYKILAIIFSSVTAVWKPKRFEKEWNEFWMIWKVCSKNAAKEPPELNMKLIRNLLKLKHLEILRNEISSLMLNLSFHNWSRKRVLTMGMAHFWTITKPSFDYENGTLLGQCCRFHNDICLKK